jgi:hypothetical protein
MGFSQLWSDNQALNIGTGESETLPKNVSVCRLDIQDVLFIIPAQVPYGLGSRPGHLLVCAGLKGGIAIKGWRFEGGDWDIDFQGGGIMLDQFSHLVQIDSPNQKERWLAAKDEAWRNAGLIKIYNRCNDEWSHVNTYLTEPFDTFMTQHFPCPLRGTNP